MRSVRNKFVKEFGEELAGKIEAAASEHDNEAHPNRGSDPFKWALLICIGYECLSNPSYRKYHGIRCSWPKVKKWIKENGHLDTHDGDCDYLSMFCGAYNEYMPKKK
jgi:hypothetical protein